MSLLASLSDTLNSWRADAEKAIARYNNREFCAAAMSVCALVAFADGKVDSSEKQRIAKAISVNPLLKVFNPDDLRKQFVEALEKLETDIDFGKMELLSVIAHVKGNEDQSRQLIRIGMIIGAADGNFDEKEKAVVADVAKELKLNPAEFGL